MLLFEAFLRWKIKRARIKRLKIHHTMKTRTLERTRLGLELILESEIPLSGSLVLGCKSIDDINSILSFYAEQANSIAESGKRSAVLPPELKHLICEVSNVWLDTFFLTNNRKKEDGIKKSISLITEVITYRERLSKGAQQAIDAWLKSVLKPLDTIVEHYTQRN